jgi:triacylglycerol lipase
MRTQPILLVALLSACVADESTPDLDKAQAAADADARPEDGKADGFDVCALAGWYGDGVCDRFCPRLDEDCPVAGAPAGDTTRYPIVLHHGMAGGRSWILTYNGIREALEADGHIVVQTQVPPFDSVEVRGAALAKAIDDTLAATGATKVNLIAHAMGGLDARYVITTLGYGDRVVSLTTMSTPHRGAALADFALELSPGDLILNAIALVVGASVSDVGNDPHLRGALTAMAEANAPAFNARTPDDSRVYYQSWSGVSSVFGSASDRARVSAVCEGKLDNILPNTFDKMRIEFVPFASIVGHNGTQPSDGMVTVASAKWGNFLGCIPGDHSDEIGRMTTGRPNPRTSWDPQRFWRDVAFDLAARGF